MKGNLDVGLVLGQAANDQVSLKGDKGQQRLRDVFRAVDAGVDLGELSDRKQAAARGDLGGDRDDNNLAGVNASGSGDGVDVCLAQGLEIDDGDGQSDFGVDDLGDLAPVASVASAASEV